MQLLDISLADSPFLVLSYLYDTIAKSKNSKFQSYFYHEAFAYLEKEIISEIVNLDLL